MQEVKKFLSKNDEQEIVTAIKTAENNTSGEIRIHVESESEKDAYERALEVFQQLEMYNTEQRNGVLIYIAVNDKSFVICGDKGIDAVVSENFWNTTKDTMQHYFKKGNFKEGIVAGVLKAGEELKAHFPWQQNDEDELSNEISKG
ncbi:MAG: TPM domain-containing protein [Polaribacter sp.]|nr:TPM domain-containing protein [Polaribacter sp.]